MTGAADLDRGTGSGWRPVSLGVEHDLEHGGRWTSLATAEREWLWRHPDPRITEARSHARPGDAFVDAGGGEECLPTVQGDPDHGDVWSRPWTFRDGWATASCPGLVERRTTSCDTGQVRVRYEIIGRPGVPFLHAVHLLLDLAPVARIAIQATLCSVSPARTAPTPGRCATAPTSRCWGPTTAPRPVSSCRGSRPAG